MNKLQLLTFHQRNAEQLKKPKLEELELRNSEIEQASKDFQKSKATIRKIIDRLDESVENAHRVEKEYCLTQSDK